MKNINVSAELYEAIQQIKMAIKEASGEDFSDEQVVELLVESFYDASFEDMEWEEMDDDVAAAHAHHNHDHKHWKEGCNCWDDCQCGDNCQCGHKHEKHSHKTDTKVTTKTNFERESDI